MNRFDLFSLWCTTSASVAPYVKEVCVSSITVSHFVTTVFVGAIGFFVASMIDHMLRIRCPVVQRVKISGYALFFHKWMYIAVGAGAMYWFLSFAPQ